MVAVVLLANHMMFRLSPVKDDSVILSTGGTRSTMNEYVVTVVRLA